MNIPVSVIERLRHVIPGSVRRFVQRFVSFTEMKRKYFEAQNPVHDILSSDKNTYPSPYRFGIFMNSAQYHQHYVKACLEMGVPFHVIDIYGDDWLEQTLRTRCDVFLVWPDGFLNLYNTCIKERLYILEHELHLPVFPQFHEIWLYENKRNMAYWLESHSIPHPRTWIFYHRKDALEFIDSCELPIVVKSQFGASATGVRIFRSRSKLRRHIEKIFRRGWTPAGHDLREKEWGFVILQEYIRVAKEWRLVRIGNSFFGHVKGRRGDFHSGSGVVKWDVPSKKHLDFLYLVTEVGNFRSMNIDVFETEDGELLVNELQTVFGASFSVDQLRIEGKPGRFVREDSGQWKFEEGDFARNACANERIRYIIESRFPERPSI